MKLLKGFASPATKCANKKCKTALSCRARVANKFHMASQLRFWDRIIVAEYNGDAIKGACAEHSLCRLVYALRSHHLAGRRHKHGVGQLSVQVICYSLFIKGWITVSLLAWRMASIIRPFVSYFT
jgi:hypothetical protein